MAGEALGTATLILDADDRLLATKLDGVQKKATRAGNGLQEALSGGLDAALPGQLGGIVSAFTSGTAAAAAFGAAIVGVGAFAVKSANDVETLKKQLTLLTGSAKQTEQIFAILQQFAIESPFEITQLIDAQKAFQGVNLTAANSIELIKALGNITSVTGGSFENLVQTVAKLQSRGFLTGEVLEGFATAKLSVGDLDRGLQNVTGKTLKQLQEEFGRIDASTVIAAITSLDDKNQKFFEGASKGTTQLDKSWASLSEAIKLASVPLGKILTPIVVGAVDQLTTATTLWGQAWEVVRTGAEGARKEIEGFSVSKALDPATYNFLPKLTEDLKSVPSLLAAVLNPFGSLGAALNIGGSKGPGSAPTGPILEETTVDRINRENEAQKTRDDNAAREIENQRKIAEARSKANNTIIDATNELATAERLLGLEGKSLKIAEAKLDIDKARAAEAKAIAEYDAALQGAGFDESAPKVIEAAAALDAAGINVQTAMLTSADAIKQAGEEAEQNFKDAASAFKDAERGLFNVLTDNRQAAILKDAASDVQKALQIGSLDISKVAEELDTSVNALGRIDFEFADPDKLLAFADRARDFSAKNDTLQQAAINANQTLTRSVEDLTRKNWQIYIQVQGQDAVVQGAMLGGVN